jgi:hypothetical protein
MTEAEWLACADPTPMLEFLRGKVSERKCRLFAVACCYLFYRGLMTDGRSRQAVATAERYADGEATEEERAAACLEAFNAWSDTHVPPADVTELAAARDAYGCSLGGLDNLSHEPRREKAALLRCLVGNPFRPGTINPAWQRPTVVSLAQAAYDNRTLPAGTLENERLAVLADALEEAGCSDRALLSHLRGPGPHVRGCWGVDLILNRG